MLSFIFSFPFLAICPNCHPIDLERQYDELSTITYDYVLKTGPYGFDFLPRNYHREIFIELGSFSDYLSYFQDLIDTNEWETERSIKSHRRSIQELIKQIKVESSYKDADLAQISRWQSRIAEHESYIEKIVSRSKKKAGLLNTGISELITRYQRFNDECIQNHPCSIAYFQRGMIHFQQGNNIGFIDDIAKIIEKGEVQKVLQESNKSEFTFYLHMGRNLNEVCAYDQAIQALDQAILANPQNKNAYLERAIAYFEKGEFDRSLQDYLQSGLKPKPVDLNTSETKEYVTGLLIGAVRGGKDGLLEYVPSMWASARGLGHGLWSLVCNPSQVSSEFIEACRNCANFIRENSTEEVVGLLVPELQELLDKKNEITSHREGEIIGYVIGKYGLDIFAGGMAVKGVKAYRGLKKANALLTFETAAIAEQNRNNMALAIARRAEVRKELAQSANLNIQWDKQGKHILGHRNYIEANLKSVISHPNPQKLIQTHAGTGLRDSQKIPGSPGYKEIINFNESIGYFIDPITNEKIPTTWGKIHYAKDGVHLVPTKPRS